MSTVTSAASTPDRRLTRALTRGMIRARRF